HTAAANQCQTTWQAAATPPTTLSPTETVEMLSWCETVHLVAGALTAADSTSTAAAAVADMADILRSQTVESPLTADLGPLTGASYGPTGDAVVSWQASCRCWTEVA